MIRMNIEKSGLERLVRDLKKMQRDLMQKTNKSIIELDKSLNEEYTRSIDELVYEKYDPIEYERTFHLRGGHGALVQDVNLHGTKQWLTFYIDEESRDPVDGTTWSEKAEKIEQGSTKMSVGFDRPFVEKTQERLERETGRTTDELIRKYEDIIRKLGR